MTPRNEADADEQCQKPIPTLDLISFLQLSPMTDGNGCVTEDTPAKQMMTLIGLMSMKCGASHQQRRKKSPKDPMRII